MHDLGARARWAVGAAVIAAMIGCETGPPGPAEPEPTVELHDDLTCGDGDPALDPTLQYLRSIGFDIERLRLRPGTGVDVAYAETMGDAGTGPESWWKDVHDNNSDSLNPGCHYEYSDPMTCNNRVLNSVLGDMCIDGRPHLINELHDTSCHRHRGDYATPHLRNCNTDCGPAGGRCVRAVVPAANGLPGCDSAKCECNPGPDARPPDAPPVDAPTGDAPTGDATVPPDPPDPPQEVACAPGLQPGDRCDRDTGEAGTTGICQWSMHTEDLLVCVSIIDDVPVDVGTDLPAD